MPLCAASIDLRTVDDMLLELMQLRQLVDEMEAGGDQPDLAEGVVAML